MLIERLKIEFQIRAKKNPAYSLRAFAKSMDLDSSTLSSILNGKRKIGFKTAHKILDHLDLTRIEKKELLFQTLNPTINTNSKIIEDAQLEIISGWEHYAILSLMETSTFQSSVKYIAARLGVSTVTVSSALKRLETVGFIKSQNGKLCLCQEGVATTQDIPSSALKKANREYIEKALFSLENHATQDRDMTGITMAINKSKLPQAKILIQEFRKSLAELLETKNKEEVYRLNVQLFSLTK